MKKFNKTSFVAALVVLSAVLTACKDPNKTQAIEKPKVIEVKAYDKDQEPIEFSLGDTNVDPTKLKILDLKFDRTMNKNFTGLTARNNNWDQITDYGWINSFTFRFVFNLSYSADISIVINNFEYCNENPDLTDFTPELSFFRDTDGNFLDQYPIEFLTISSPNKNKVIDHVIDTETLFIRDYAVKLQYNEYEENGVTLRNMQNGFSVRDMFYPELLKKDDTVTFKYKIKSAKELPDIIVNLIDTSSEANYWKTLSAEDEVDQKLVQGEPTLGEDNFYYYTGTLEYTVSTRDVYNVTLQFTCKDTERLSKTETIDFYICGNPE